MKKTNLDKYFLLLVVALHNTTLDNPAQRGLVPDQFREAIKLKIKTYNINTYQNTDADSDTDTDKNTDTDTDTEKRQIQMQTQVHDDALDNPDHRGFSTDQPLVLVQEPR